MNKFYLAGDKSMVANTRGISYAKLYDPNLNKWTFLPNMSILKYKYIRVAWEEKVLVVGGFINKEDSDKRRPFTILRSSIELYDMQVQKWNLMVRMWQLDILPDQIVIIHNRLFSSNDCLKARKDHMNNMIANLTCRIKVMDLTSKC